MTARKSSRRRGAILTVTGYRKLQVARIEFELAAHGGRHTKEDLCKLTGLSLNTISKIFGNVPSLATEQQVAVDKQSLQMCFAAFNLVLERCDYLYPETASSIETSDRNVEPTNIAAGDDLPLAIEDIQPTPAQPMLESDFSTIDWGEAPDTTVFYGRVDELTQLTQWVNEDRCKLVAILGMGGIGKTALVTKLTHQLQSQFQTIVWRSLRNAPLLTNLLPELIQIFSHQVETIAPKMDLSTQISRLLHYFSQSRCLLVLDNAESIIQTWSDRDSSHQHYLGYQELMRRIGESGHQSCLLLTSREKPEAIVPLEGERLTVRTLAISGLNADDSENLFYAKGLSASSVSRARLCEIYSGNPLALKIVATSIGDLFDGDIDSFLATKAVIFNGIGKLLDRQFERLSPAEQVIMHWLAIEREWVSTADLHAQIVPTMPIEDLLTTLEYLARKSLIEHSQGKFTQQAMVMEYVIKRTIERVSIELANWNPQAEAAQQLPQWLSHPLMKAQSPTHIRAAQTELILAPIARQIQSQFVNRVGLERHVRAIIASLQTHYRDRPHYGGGNLINLLRYLQIDLVNYNFANLAVWQADLRGAILHNVNFSGADFANSLFTETFGWITSVAFSPDSQILVTGEYKGKISLWHTGKKHLIDKFIGHNSWITAISFSPDGHILASSGQDGTIRLWEVATGRVIHILEIDANLIALSVCFHPDGQILVTGHSDGKIVFWNVLTGEPIETQSGGSSQIYSIDFSSDGRLLATGSEDGIVKIWNVLAANQRKIANSTFVQILTHDKGVPSIKFSADGKFLATGSVDGKIQLWDIVTWKVFAVFPTYSDWLFSVCISPDSQLLAAANQQNEVKIWDLSKQQSHCLHSPVAISTLCGHQSLVSSIEFSPDGNLLVTTGQDWSVRLWNTHSWQEVYHWQGYTNSNVLVAFEPDGNRLITTAVDGIAWIWDVRTGKILRTLPGNDRGIFAADYNPHRKLFASATWDRTIEIRDTQTGQLVDALSAHQGNILQVRYSPNGKWLASSGMDNKICLWDEQEELVATLLGHSTFVRALVFCPDSKLLATGCYDGYWRLWDLATKQMIGCYQAHAHWIIDLAFCPVPAGSVQAQGRRIASCSADRTAKLWDLTTGELLQTYTGHKQEILAIEFNPDGKQLATGSSDRTIKIWDVETGQVLQTFTGHQERVTTLNYSCDGSMLASGCGDETIKLWDIATGDCLLTCKPPAPYMGTCIAGTTGLTAATIDSLKTLGAIDLG